MKNVFILVCFCSNLVSGSIHNKLRYFETLKGIDIRSRVRRSTDSSHSHYIDLSFSALGRNFDLLLKPDAGILADGFKAYLVNEDGSSSSFFLNKNEFYSGHTSDDESAHVQAHLEDQIWNIEVQSKDDVYSFEPAWRHLPPSDNHSIIAYRHSDIRWNSGLPGLIYTTNSSRKLCDSVKVDVEKDGGEIEYPEEEISDHKRRKRQSWLMDINTCNLIVVADHLFFKGIGGGFKHRTANYLVGLFQRIENIYRSTLWNEKTGLRGFGFQIKEMRVHDSITVVDKGKYHYNMNNTNQWGTRFLLEEFSQDTYFSGFCLAHLFTYQKFGGGVLGLAYIASPRVGTVGGICSSTYKKKGVRYILNTGWSSSMNTGGERLLTQEAMLVTAHELGHNWGSEHDGDSSECAPSGFNNGKYLMYPYAVSGFEENNHKFSPCSRRYVADVLRNKAYRCFKERKENVPYCGNGIIDSGEDCDGGDAAISGKDPCCSSNCKFKQAATCSPMNHECCENCQMASSNYYCRQTVKLSCQKSTKCNGSSFDCPQAEHVRDKTPCLDGGKCFNGICVSYCEAEDRTLEPCQCSDSVKTACHRCCKAKTNGSKCVQYGNERLIPGRPCYLGYCSKEGVCIKSDSELVERLFDFIEKLTSSKIVEFMRSNIVGTVIVFSMAIWIPASWAFSYIDKKKQKLENDRLKWRSRESRDLIWREEYKALNMRHSRRNKLARPAMSPRRQLSQSNPSISSMERESTV